jgi:hypothetical protein
MNKINSYCYICGKPNADSDDHIPPKCLFPKRFHNSIPKVPAHRDCNSQYSNEDTYLRDCLTLACAHYNNIAKEVFHDAVVRSWTKPEALKYWRYLKSQFLRIKSPYPNSELFAIDANRIRAQICRISRGLFCYQYKMPMNLNLVLEAYMIEPSYILIDTVNLAGKSCAENSFKYLISIPYPEFVLGKTIICFYNKIWFQVNISENRKP